MTLSVLHDSETTRLIDSADESLFCQFNLTALPSILEDRRECAANIRTPNLGVAVCERKSPPSRTDKMPVVSEDSFRPQAAASRLELRQFRNFPQVIRTIN